MEHHGYKFSLIVEGATNKVQQFIMPLVILQKKHLFLGKMYFCNFKLYRKLNKIILL